jgi:hypothetical protein
MPRLELCALQYAVGCRTPSTARWAAVVRPELPSETWEGALPVQELPGSGLC